MDRHVGSRAERHDKMRADEDCSPSSATSQPRLPHVRLTSEQLPVKQQFAFWRDSWAPYIDLSRPYGMPDEEFVAVADYWRFGPLMLSLTRLPACNHRRNADQIRRDSVDHWVIIIMRRGVQRQRGHGPDIELQRGVPYVFSMADTYEAERTSAELEQLVLYVPRDVAVECEQHLAALRSRPMCGPIGAMLADHLAALAACMPQIQADVGARLATATLALIAAAAMHEAGADIAERPQIAELQLARVKRIIRQNLGAATLGPARLCAAAGISRSQIYRLLEPFGGVAHYIQQERLRVAYRRLADPGERRNIARIAEEVGFFEASTFSRAFRKEFACTPRDVRMGASGGQAVDGARAAWLGGDRALGAMLRDL